MKPATGSNADRAHDAEQSLIIASDRGSIAQLAARFSADPVGARFWDGMTTLLDA